MADSRVDVELLRAAGSLVPLWMPDGESFVVCRTLRAGSELLLIDPRRSATTRLAAHVGEITPAAVSRDGAVSYQAEGAWFEVSPSAGPPRRLGLASGAIEDRRRARPIDAFPVVFPISELGSPDGGRFLVARDGDLWTRAAGSEDLVPLTDDGSDDLPWSDGRWSYPASTWSPDGMTVAAWQMDATDVPRIPVVDNVSGSVTRFVYPASGEAVPIPRLTFVDVDAGTRIPGPVDADFPYVRAVGWRQDGREFLYAALRRDCRRLEVRAVDPRTGVSRVVAIDENETFIASPASLFSGDPIVAPLPDGRCLLSSERTGWRHLYLADGEGSLRAVTTAEFPIADVVHVDTDAGRVVVLARPDPERPYDRHLLVYPLAGGVPERLTTAPGDHEVRFSPSGSLYLDTYSSAHRMPTTEVRSADGTLLMTVEHPGVGEALNAGFVAPEEFVALAADGTTPLHGLVFPPYDIDGGPHPVVQMVYGGPHLEYVPHTFADVNGNDFREELRARGFWVVLVDARGTPGRSKVFHDVAFGAVGRHEVADYVAVLRHLARTRDGMDLDRVGVVGGSFGGYMATRAMLQAPEVYRVGVAECPVADLTTAMVYVTESYLGGTPDEVPEVYRHADNTRLAGRLEGRLLITHGTSDVNAPFGHSVRLVDAIQRAGRRVDLVVVPGADHAFRTASGPYPGYRRVVLDYLSEHLGVSPCEPDASRIRY